MNAKTIFLVVAATVVFSTSLIHGSQSRTKNVVASDIDGNRLLNLCSEQVGRMEFQFCEAFIVGVRDGVVVAGGLLETKPIFDIPIEVKQQQMKDVVLKYLTDRPESRHKAGALLVILSFREAFPSK